jgi:hypothetical protein
VVLQLPRRRVYQRAAGKIRQDQTMATPHNLHNHPLALGTCRLGHCAEWTGLGVVGIGADRRAADQYLGQLAGVVPCICVRAIIGDVACGIVGIAVAAHRADLVVTGRHSCGDRAAVHFGQAVGCGVVGIGDGTAAVFFVQPVQGIASLFYLFPKIIS